MLASSAIPGVFPPVSRDGRDLYDGGLVANVPALQALERGARSLVVLDCAFPGQQLRRPTNLVETALYAFTIQMRQQALRDLPVAAERVPVLSIPGPEPLSISPLDFAAARPLIASAYDVANDFPSPSAQRGESDGNEQRRRPPAQDEATGVRGRTAEPAR